jgi:outer membrane protein OmpU
LDNGLTICVNSDRYSDRDDSSGDDVFLQISSDTIGKIRVGQTKGAAYALSHTSPSVGAVGNNDGDVQDWISRPSNITADQTHTASESNDGQKIVYWTPNFAGFQAGLSYGVNRNNAGLEGPINVGGLGGQASTLKADGTISTTNNNNDTAWDAGIAYNGEFSGVSVGADVTYQRDFNGGTTGVAVDDREAWRGGLSVGVAGFTIGGSYRDTDNEGNVKNIDASGWDVGVAYATGPYGVSLSYMSLEQDNATNPAVEDTDKSWVLGGSYDMGAGVKLVGSVFSAEYENGNVNTVNNTSDNEAFGVVTGIEVNF